MYLCSAFFLKCTASKGCGSGGSQSGEQGGNQNGGSGTGGNGGSQSAPPPAAPTISGKTSFLDSTTVSLSGPDGADIYYTLDGSTPTAESTMYTEAFGLSDTTTVKAVAIKDGQSSQVVSETFIKAGSDAPEDD